ncbi:hypothetical protein CBR_g45307 [Chara braunii]|uniref:Uncharacterized protein n=1 Tax=Chara braunii TaxID=69332 RepID=A0A388LY46_CHABU|nr:hypothetical protein CBR_g45307 [Chara braunii]|eukprot:GBG87248.1 hypothetical protein CBR_g45307 [Chara braunii]
METEQGGTGDCSPLGAQMEISQQGDSGQTSSKEQEMGEATGQDEGDTGNGTDFSERRSASSATKSRREEEGGEGEEEEDSEESSSEEGWEDEEEEEPETLETWVKCVQALEWERTMKCEVRLARHKHLRNLKDATTSTEGITTTNRFEILKKEKEINAFYAKQYGWKAQHHNNDIQVRKEVYSKQFEWPQTYLPKAMKRSESKPKASSASTGEEMGDEELIEDARRQAAILEDQINVLKDQNRELGEDTMNLEKITYAQHKEIEAVAMLYARNSPRRRVIIPFKWNEVHKDWEVAIHRSLVLVTIDEANCSGQALKGGTMGTMEIGESIRKRDRGEDGCGEEERSRLRPSTDKDERGVHWARFRSKGRERRRDCDVLCIGAAGQDAVAVKTKVGGITVRETVVLKTAAVETATVETAAAETGAVETGAMETAAVETATGDTAAVETVVVDIAAVETTKVDTAAVKTAGVETPTVETAGVETAAVETAVATDE